MNLLLLQALHVAAAFAVFASLGAVLLAGSRKKSASILHGVGLVLVLLIGFAMLQKPPMDQHWWMVKIGLWFFIGLAPALAKRRVMPAWIVLTLCIAAGFGAAYLGIFKPF